MKILANCVMLTLLISSFPALAFSMDTIRVLGKAQKKYPPDVAYMNVQVWAKAKSAKDAQERNADEFSRVEKVLTSQFKIEKKDVQTRQFNLNPEYQYNNNKQVLVGYNGTHTLQVTVRDLPRLGNLVDHLISAKRVDDQVGVNIEGISFGTEKTEKYEAEVLADAMKDARARADVIAREAGRTIKSVHAVAHGTSNFNTPRWEEPLMMDAAAAPRLKGGANTSISTGEITISTDVTVEYELNQ